MSWAPQDAVQPLNPQESPAPSGPVMESFASVVLRRTRYIVAIALCAYVLGTAGWALVFPTQVPAYATASLLLGSPAGGLVATLGILILLMVCVAVSAAEVHPDTPHLGMYCACLGLMALSIRGGSMQLVAAHAARTRDAPAFFSHLAAESVVWLAIVLLLEAFTIAMFRRVFRNLRWLEHSGSSPATPDALRQHPSANPLVRLTLGDTAPPAPEGINAWIASLGATAITVLVASGFLMLLLRSELKGQVFLACFTAFGVAAAVAHQAFPSARTWAIWAGVPLTALLGYLLARNDSFSYPGHVGLQLARALPIDYIAAGLPGAILGYYTALRWHIHQIVHEQ